MLAIAKTSERALTELICVLANKSTAVLPIQYNKNTTLIRTYFLVAIEDPDLPRDRQKNRDHPKYQHPAVDPMCMHVQQHRNSYT